MNEVINTMLARRSIRKYKDIPVPRETLETLLQAAMAAPSAMNSQPWEFVVVTDPKTLEDLRNNLMFAKMKAPAAICVLGSDRSRLGKAGIKFWVQDCSAATENILLAATSLGLGSVWIGIHPVVLFERTVKNILNLPAGVTPFNLIYVGYPDEVKEPRTQYDEKRVHWEAFPVTGKDAKPKKSLLGKEKTEH